MNTAFSDRAAAIDAQTPDTRDRVVDLLRAASLAVVIGGHWLMATITQSDGKVAGSNILADLPVLHPVTWIFQVMPIFFVAGGFANHSSWCKARSHGEGYAGYLDRRLRRLLRPTIVFLLTVPIALIGLDLAGLGATERALIAGLLAGPLWFLAVFVMTTALAPIMSTAHERRPIATAATLLVTAVAIDIGRMTWWPELGYLNLLVAWLFVHQLGFWYATGATLLRRRVLWRTLGGAVLALVALTGPGPYPVSMVGLPGEMSNMAPPSICLLVLAIGQFAGVLLVRRKLAAWLRRPAPWRVVVTIGSMAMSLYLWHLVVLTAGFGTLAVLGTALPEPGSALWWISRPLWLAALAAVLTPLAAALSRLEHPSAGPLQCRVDLDVLTVPASSSPNLPCENVKIDATLQQRSVMRGAVGVVLAVTGLFGLVLGGLAPTSTTAACVMAVAVAYLLIRPAVPKPAIRG